MPPERVDAIVDHLMGDALWSGWGVRTMSSDDGAYNPLAYHNGTIWPHDNSLIAWGLARYGRWPEAQRIVRQMLTAGRHFDYQLPEVFAGLPRTETRFPIAYPTAARPQAWAAGTARAPLAAAARAPARPASEHAGDRRAAGAAGLGRIPQTVRRARVRATVGDQVGGGERSRERSDMNRDVACDVSFSPRGSPARPSEMTGRHAKSEKDPCLSRR